MMGFFLFAHVLGCLRLVFVACNLFICCSYVGLVKTGSCSLQSVYMLLLCWAALYCIVCYSLLLLKEP